MNKSGHRFVYSLSVLACALPLALSSSSLSKGNAEGLFDYCNGTHLSYLGGGDLLSKTGISMEESEVAYLNAYDNLRLQYSETFLDDDVKTSLINGTRYVFAHEKSYRDDANREWTWTPISVKGDTTTPFYTFDDLYIASFPEGSLSNVEINYELKLNVSQQVFNSYINKTYQDALSLDNIYEKYLADYAYYERRPTNEEQYQTQLIEYQAYLEAYQAYLNQEENYEIYLANKAKYDEDLAAYNAYLAAKQQYEEDCVAYKQNQEDWAYYLANHEQNLKEYNEFGIKYENSRYQLNAMQIAYEQDTERSSSMAQYILSNTVATVLARKDELSVLGVPSDLVDAADSATVKLRTCLREYDDLTTDEARYSYYYINYNYIKSNANILLRSLERLGRYPSVTNVAKDRGKLPQFYTLLFQLIYFCNAVSDTVVYNYEAFNPVTGKGDMSKSGAAILDENFVIDGATYKSWLKGYDFLDTSKTATPSSGILPTQQVILIPEPPKLPVPVEPAIVQKPIAPTPVIAPVAPSEVLEPIPYDPDAVAPDYPAILENTLNQNLLSSYRNGKISKRDLIANPVEITISGQRNIALADYEVNVAIFHNYLAEPTQYVFFTTGVEYNGEVPIHPADQEFTEYYFDYWTTQLNTDPTPVDLRTLANSANLYPIFDHGERQRYQITWVYDDGEEATTVLSGSIPSAPRLPLKEETDEHYYVFSHWSPTIEEAFENQTYTAVFDEFNIFDITYSIDGHDLITREKENYLPNAPTTYSLGDGTYYVITGWQESLSPIGENTTYHALFDKYYTITWNILGEVYTERYLAGSKVTFKGDIPDPIRQNQYYQMFEFDQDLGFANSNRTITANYVDHAYPEIILKIDGNSINLTGQYLPDEEIEKPTSYNTNTYHYDITGWTQSGGVYTATFVKTPFISDDVYYNYVGADIRTLRVNAIEKHVNSVNVGYLLSKISEGQVDATPFDLLFENGEVYLTSTQVRYMALKSVANIGIEFSDLGNKSYSIKVVVTDSDGNDVEISDFFTEVTINRSVDHLHSQVYLGDEEVNASLSANSIKFRPQINKLYQVIPTYSVAVRASNSVQVSLSKTSGRVGDIIHVSYQVQQGYKLETIVVYTKSGDEIKLDSQNNFVLPADDVVINCVCSRLQFTVKLYVDDALYASYNANYGDTILLPTYIKKVGDETYEYMFVGWGITSDSLTVTEDTVLRAEFIQVERDQKSEKKTSNLVKIAGYVAIGTLVAGLGVGLFFIFRKIIKH